MDFVDKVNHATGLTGSLVGHQHDEKDEPHLQQLWLNQCLELFLESAMNARDHHGS